VNSLFVGCNGKVAAIDLTTGAELWRTKLKSGVLSATSLEDVAVLDQGDKVYAGCNGHLFCLNATTGEILWHNQLEGMGYNDVTLSIDGRSVQATRKVVRQSN
jgi:hypothetical protein